MHNWTTLWSYPDNLDLHLFLPACFRFSHSNSWHESPWFECPLTLQKVVRHFAKKPKNSKKHVIRKRKSSRSELCLPNHSTNFFIISVSSFLVVFLLLNHWKPSNANWTKGMSVGELSPIIWLSYLMPTKKYMIKLNGYVKWTCWTWFTSHFALEHSSHFCQSAYHLLLVDEANFDLTANDYIVASFLYLNLLFHVVYPKYRVKEHRNRDVTIGFIQCCHWQQGFQEIFLNMTISYSPFPSSTYTLFFISNTMLKLAKIQVNAKQHPEAELQLFENYSHSSSTLSSKNIRTYSKK